MEGSPTGGGRGARFWLLAIVAIYAVVFILLNSQEVKIKFVFATTNAPLVFALALAFILGAVIGYFGGRFRERD